MLLRAAASLEMLMNSMNCPCSQCRVDGESDWDEILPVFSRIVLDAERFSFSPISQAPARLT